MKGGGGGGGGSQAPQDPPLATPMLRGTLQSKIYRSTLPGSYREESEGKM